MHQAFGKDPSRRQVLMGAAASAALPTLVSAAPLQDPALPGIDIGDRLDNARTYMRLIGDLSGPSTYRYHSGRMLSVSPHKVMGEPFCDFVAIKHDRVRQLDAQTYQHGYRGVILFTELGTGRVLDELPNPVTGKRIKVKHFKTSRGSIVYAPEGVYSLRAAAPPGPVIPEAEKPFRLGWEGAGPDLWLTYDERYDVKDAEGNFLFADSSMYRLAASRKQVADQALGSVDIVMSWQTQTNWWDWMEMGDRPGHILFGSLGRKYPQISDLPQAYVAAAEARFPGHLTTRIDWAEHEPAP